jgi:hypothetical protein
MMLSDQQIVAGIAVLVAAIIGLAEPHPDSIRIYHFSIVSDLAWFSSNTHLLSLLVLVSYDDSVKSGIKIRSKHKLRSRRNRCLRTTRIAFMLILAVLLLYTCYISGYENWYDEFQCPTKCVMAGQKGGEPRQWMIVNFVAVIYGYSIHIFMLSRSARILWVTHTNSFLRPKASHRHTQLTKTAMRIPFLLWHFLASEVVMVAEICAWFGLGVYWVMSDRIIAHGLMDASEIDKEDRMGFGQLVPLILLVLPFMQLFESYSSRVGEQNEDPSTNSSIELLDAVAPIPPGQVCVVREPSHIRFARIGWWKTKFGRSTAS